jgi:protein-S-isoprenylcysteine O-methyltransferase Ste14
VTTVTTGRTTAESSDQRTVLGLRALIGSGDRIGLFVLPFAAVGLVLNLVFPAAFAVGGPPAWLQLLSWIVLAIGVVVWGWSVALLLTQARTGGLITTGPYALVAHPLYTAVGLLVLPWLGFLLDSWLGALVGAALYLGSRLFAPAEEVELADRFGAEWDAYRRSVAIPWL